MVVAKKTSAAEPDTIVIRELRPAQMKVKIIGTTPLILNAMSQKARHELLLPKKKTMADRAANLKHDVLAEYRQSPYIIDNEKAPTLIGVMAAGFKAGMGTAAMRTGGAKRTEIEQLVRMPEILVPVFGAPKLFMSITRSADMNRTPDVRTRAIIPEWCTEITVSWVDEALNTQSILNLLNAAGFVAGLGDWRQERGSASFGSYTLVTEANEAEFERIKAEGGRAVQRAALETPSYYDNDTQRLYEWYVEELKVRGDTGKTKRSSAEEPASDAGEPEASPAKRGRKPKANGHDTANAGAH